MRPRTLSDDTAFPRVGNNLDNAWINFDQCELPASALLGKHAEVTPEGEYRLKTAGVLPFEMIGQRLYTGRVAVAQAALAFRSELFRRTRAYSDAKPTYARGVDELPVLSDVPQLRALFEENAAAAAATEAFVGQCEARLSECLVGGTTPPPDLVDAIATAKVVAVEQSIDACHRLKQEVGSFALMADAGFLHLDMLQCCKFAEVRREKPPLAPFAPGGAVNDAARFLSGVRGASAGGQPDSDAEACARPAEALRQGARGRAGC